MKKIALILMILGIATIAVASIVTFEKTERYGQGRFRFSETGPDEETKNAVLFSGIGAFVLGGVLLVVGMKKKSSG